MFFLHYDLNNHLDSRFVIWTLCLTLFIGGYAFFNIVLLKVYHMEFWVIISTEYRRHFLPDIFIQKYEYSNKMCVELTPGNWLSLSGC